MENNKIGKNTLFLYLRSFLTLLVSLYTARVILDKLGADDYGIFNTVGAVTASLSFLTSSLALATSRFLTYDLGKGDKLKLKETFKNLYTLYAILATIIVICLEIVGPWFINSKLVFEASREFAVNATFHLVIAMMICSMMQTPFTSLIIAHEDMKVFAYLGLLEAFAKLLICYFITITSYDRLIVYAILLLIVQFTILLVNTIYTKIHYEEVVLKFSLQKDIINSIGSFAGWSLIGRFANVLQIQGTNIITNMFFGPAVVAARTISIQVNNALNSFVGNFMMAVNPQILKRHASGNDNSSNALVQKSTILSFILAALICFPVMLNADYLLTLWLKEVPEYTIPFVKIILIQSIFATIENGMYSIFYSRGRVKENALISPNLDILMFIIVYILFKNGASPVMLSYCFLSSCLLSCFIVKPYLIHKLFGYNRTFFLLIDKSCLKFVLFAIPLYLAHEKLISEVNFSVFIIETVICIIYLSLVSYLFVIDHNLRKNVNIALGLMT